MKRFISLIILLASSVLEGSFKALKNFVIPAVHFIEEVKCLINTDDKKDGDKKDDKTDWLKYFAEKIGCAIDFVKKTYCRFSVCSS